MSAPEHWRRAAFIRTGELTRVLADAGISRTEQDRLVESGALVPMPGPGERRWDPKDVAGVIREHRAQARAERERQPVQPTLWGTGSRGGGVR